MEHVRSIVPLKLTCARAEELLFRYFDARRGTDGKAVVPLIVPLREQPLRVQLTRRRDHANLNDELAVVWAPSRPGMFPSFSGRLITCVQAGCDEACLELEGAYEPSYGSIIGEALDATIGHAMVQRAADTLVEEVAAELQKQQERQPY